MKKYLSEKPFLLENGAVLPGLEIAYHAYGVLRPGTRVVWICHALTANSDVLSWWGGLVGPGRLFDPAADYILCANVLGGCYGTTGPLTEDPRTGHRWYHGFPSLTIRDLVSAHRELADHLGITSIDVLVGGSLGGQQALEWAISDPDRVRQLVLIATNAHHSPWGIAFNEAQRMAIETDPSWHTSSPEAGMTGMRTARAIALLSYRNYDVYGETQQESDDRLPLRFRAAAYQRYQGQKLAHRFNAFTYHLLSRAMDSHHVGRGRGGIEAALRRIRASTLVIGIRSDLLFPPAEQQFLAHHIPDATLRLIDSSYGHDGFLIESEQLTQCIQPFLQTTITYTV